MRLRFTILSLLLSVFTYGQTGVLGVLVSQPRPTLIWITGESNSGGQAANSSLSVAENGPRAAKILHNNLYEFQPLEVGVNNLIGHPGLTNNATHGLELGIANRVDSGILSNVYIVKTGAGGSQIGHWAVGGTYLGSHIWDTAMRRVDSAIAIIERTTGQTPILKVAYSQGINDDIAGTNTTTWKTNTIELFSRMRSRYGATLPIVMTRFEGPSMTERTAINTAIDEIDAADAYTVAVSTQGAATDDENHWSYTGYKTVAGRLISALLALE